MKQKYLTLTGVLILILITSCKDVEQKGPVKLRPVKTTKPMVGQVADNMDFNGLVKESGIAGVAFRVGGTVNGIYVNEGDYVQSGDLLASLDARDYKVGLNAAEAQFVQAKSEYERYQGLYNQGKFPANSYEKIKTNFVALKSNYEKAINTLADTRLYAPFSGYIYKRSINNHETIAPGSHAFTIVNIHDLDVVFGVPETILPMLTSQITATARVSGIDIPTKLRSIATKSGDNNLYEVHLSFQNPDKNKVRPGMSAKVFVTYNKESGNNVFTLPVQAVFYRQKKSYVWIYDNVSQVVTSKMVVAGNLNSLGQIEILQGLSGDETIVVGGVNSLFENQKVRVVAENKTL